MSKTTNSSPIGSALRYVLRTSKGLDQSTCSTVLCQAFNGSSAWGCLAQNSRRFALEMIRIPRLLALTVTYRKPTFANSESQAGLFAPGEMGTARLRVRSDVRLDHPTRCNLSREMLSRSG